MKHYLAQGKCATILYNNNSITINQFKKSELQFLSVSEIRKFHTLTVNFKDWPFSAIVTRHFRPKSGHLIERVNFKPIDKTVINLENLFIEGSGSFLRPTGFWIKKHKYKRTENVFFKKQVSLMSTKYHKSTVPNIMTIDLLYNIFDKSYK